jgi:DNA ligase-1
MLFNVTFVRIPTSFKSLLLAESWNHKFDPRGYYLSEKLDGVRAIWTGSQFYSRYGNPIYSPGDSFNRHLPTDIVLDGELFRGRGKFQQTVSAVRKLDPIESEWNDIKFVVFDAPMLNMKYEERYKLLTERFAVMKLPTELANPTIDDFDPTTKVIAIESRVCEGIDDLNQVMAVVEANGGEGVMLRAASSRYEWRRSWTLTKVGLSDPILLLVLIYH